MKMRWRKVRGDPRQYRSQWALMLFILVIGIAGVMAALNARAILSREIPVSFESARVPDLVVWVDRLDAATLSLVRAVDGVGAADMRGTIITRVATTAGGWLPMRLSVVDDFSAQQTGVVHLHGGGGNWPDSATTIFIEQSGRSIIAGDVGKPLAVRTASGEISNIVVGGFVHDTAVAPSTQERMIYGYITPAAAKRLAYNTNFDQLLVKMPVRGSDNDVAELAASIKKVLGESGVTVSRTDLRQPQHPHQGLMMAMLRVLAILAALALASATALTGYLFSAWMRREARQVAVMKTIGAQTYHIASQYLLMALPLIVMAIAIAFPAGIWLGQILAGFEADILNIDLLRRDVPMTLLLQALVMVVLVPLVAMALPIIRAARKSVRETLADPGIAALPVLTRFVSQLLVFGRSVGFSLGMRNAWRRPWRLTIMVLAFSAGGALLLTTRSNYESLMHVVDTNLAEQAHDIEVFMPQAVLPVDLERVARSTGDTTVAEAWRRARVTTGAAAGEGESPERFGLVGYPVQSRLFKRPVVEGRSPRAANEILVTRYLHNINPALRTGAKVGLVFRERRTSVEIVGMVDEIASAVAYADAATFDRITGLDERAGTVRIKTNNADIEMAANTLDRAYMTAKLPPSQIFTKTMLRDSLEEHFFVVGEVIRIVAFAIAFVGAIVLVAATALNVAERARELAIMRTIGATRHHIMSTLLVEAVSVVVLGITISIAGSVVLTRAMLDAAERLLLHVSVPLIFSSSGMLQLCASAVLIVATVWVCLYLSLRHSVVTALAYE